MARQHGSQEEENDFVEAQQSEEDDVGMNEYERERAARIASLNAYLQPALDAANDLYVSFYTHNPRTMVLLYQMHATCHLERCRFYPRYSGNPDYF